MAFAIDHSSRQTRFRRFSSRSCFPFFFLLFFLFSYAEGATNLRDSGTRNRAASLTMPFGHSLGLSICDQLTRSTEVLADGADLLLFIAFRTVGRTSTRALIDTA